MIYEKLLPHFLPPQAAPLFHDAANFAEPPRTVVALKDCIGVASDAFVFSRRFAFEGQTTGASLVTFDECFCLGGVLGCASSLCF